MNATTVAAAAAVDTEPVPRAPPGTWRILGPALALWAATAIVISCAGSWWVLVSIGMATGALACGLLVRGRKRRRGAERENINRRGVGTGPHAGTGIGQWLLAYGAVLAALFMVTGVRIGVGETQRIAPQLSAAITSGDSIEVRVKLSDYPSLDTASTSQSITGWVPAQLQRSPNQTKVVLWFQSTTVDAGVPTHASQLPPDHSRVALSKASEPTPVQQNENLVPSSWAPGTELLLSGRPVTLELTSGAAYGIRVERTTAVAPAPQIMVGAAELRAQLRARAELVPGAALVPGFAVGDTALVSEQLDAEMQASSLKHLVAVSGANCALVTSAAIWVLSWLGCGRKVRAASAGLALAGFVLIVGPDTSVQRAAIMGAVLLVSSYGGKRATALPALGLAIVVLLIADPWHAWQPGFALSVAATGGIVLCAPELTEWLRRLTRVPTWVALPVAVSAAAQFACCPLLLLLQDGIPASGLIANVLAGPAAPAGTALGLAGLLAGPVFPWLAQMLVVAASWPARWVEAAAKVTSELPFARWDWVPGVPGALLLCAFEAAVVVAWLLATGRLTRTGARVIRPWKPDQPGPRILRTWVSVLLGCAAGILVGPTLIAPTMQRAGVPSDWRIVACDVGQGDAMLLRGSGASAGEAVLVDTGDDETQLRTCLRLFGVTRISLLVLTHDDRDHIGAVGAVLPFTDAALVAPGASEDKGPRPLLTQLDAAGVPWRSGGAGDTGTDAGVVWGLLAPDRGLTPATRNSASLVMRADMSDVSALLLADTGESEQSQLLHASTPHAAPESLGADVVKVAHHGSRDQYARMYDAAAAQIGLVSVGAGNGYGHPAKDTMAALASAGTSAMRTDELGSIAVSPGLDRVGVWAERGRAVSGDR